jgi:hypothetical protein
MLRTMKDIQGCAIHATDGDMGHVDDFYFDDETWVIRYFVVDTSAWLAARNSVLISPIAIGQSEVSKKVLTVSNTKQQVQDSPSIDTQKPVSRQHEIEHLRYFGYPFYWGGAGLWGAGAYPSMMTPGYEGVNVASHDERLDREAAYAQADVAAGLEDNTHLRSCKAVMDYRIMATDGDIGHIHSLLVDEETWAIRYLVVKTSNWWRGNQVLIAPQWIKGITWSSATVSVELTRQSVIDAPPYDSTELLNRAAEANIYEHYGHPSYWGE